MIEGRGLALPRIGGAQVEEIVVITFDQAPAIQAGTLLRELNHRIENQLSSAIHLISAQAVLAEGREAKASLSNVVELLHGYAEVQSALLKPKNEALIDTAIYLRKLCCALRRALLDPLNIQLTLKGESLPLQPERCWHFGLIIHELVTNAAKHACFDGRTGTIKVKLARTDALVNCVVIDNGSVSPRGEHGQGPRIASDLAKYLGGRIEHGVGVDFRSVVLSFPLTEGERRANGKIASRTVRPLRRIKAIGSGHSAAVAKSSNRASRPIVVASVPHPDVSPVCGGETASPCRSTEVLGELFSPSHRMDAL